MNGEIFKIAQIKVETRICLYMLLWVIICESGKRVFWIYFFLLYSEFFPSKSRYLVHIYKFGASLGAINQILFFTFKNYLYV